jgi:large subunit ribosomal protein L13
VGFTNTSSRQKAEDVTRTYSPKASELKRDWVVIDATDVVLGRLASHVAAILRGKNKPTFTPNLDNGDNVIVVNAAKVVLTNGKAHTKLAWRHSGYPGGIRSESYADILENNPERAIEKAVRGMLPKTSLGRQQFTKLHVYRGAEHPHAGQKPVPYTFDQIAQ